MIPPSSFRRGDHVQLTRDMPTYHTRPVAGRPGVPRNAQGMILAIYQSETEDPLHLVLCEFESDSVHVMATTSDMTLVQRPTAQDASILTTNPIRGANFATLHLRSRHRIQNVIERHGSKLEGQNLWFIPNIDDACRKLLGTRLPSQLGIEEQDTLKVFEKMQEQGYEQSIFVFGDQ